MNRLGQEPSPYLRQHADNPVDWYPWGEEALERARREDKPILLSIGYSACHWCHVMAHESFENPDTAALMNAHFVNIKVDREERPDLDQLYQGVVQLMGRGGGWPLTVFLLPDLRPFFGGTYFPPAPRYGMPGFPQLLEHLAEIWRTRRQDLETQAERFREGLAFIAAHGLDAQPVEVTGDDVVRAAEVLLGEVDPTHGGFGGAPKFPNPANVALLLRGWRRSGREELLGAATFTLEKMAQGGIYDQLGGGFHRYAVDARWRVPHFEKMLYDNAQLLHLYAEAQQVKHDELWGRVAHETVRYLQREMTSPEGAFYAAQDADSEGEEGKYFVWTEAEIDAALPGPLREVAKRYFGVTPQGNFEHGRNVLEAPLRVDTLALQLGRDPASVRADLAEAKRILFEVREQRARPGLDDKILAGWNGLMIRGLAFASRVFDEPGWAVHAARAADFVLTKMWDGQRLKRSFQRGEARIEGFLEDYGDLAAGLVALYQATFDAKYVEAAEAIVERAVALFWDEEKQAYFSARRGQTDLLPPTYALHDNAAPSGASTLTEAQLALAALTGKPSYLEQAGQYLSKMKEAMSGNPFAFGHLLLAADAYVDGAAEVTLVGSRARLRELLEVTNRTWAPTTAVIAHDPANPVPQVLKETLEARTPVNGAAAAYYCHHFTCERPITDPQTLRERLSSGSASQSWGTSKD
ncbi:MAG: thioredoxin domain-containing protein [Myxococcaceae bacterium]|nr:thioredoxin domain-containing protein [Myxococcaceae bacterium]